MTPTDFFKLNKSKYGQSFRLLANTSNKLSFVRLTVFLILVSLIILLSSYTNLTVITLSSVLGLMLFIRLVSYHKDIDNKKQFHKTLQELNIEELDRISGHLPENRDGERFTKRESFFASDLDLFGEKSLFHQVNRCYLPVSQEKLADLLTTPVSKSEIEHRHHLLNDLESQIDWVQEYIATLKLHSTKVKEHPNLDFLSSLKPQAHIRWTAWLLRILSLTAIGLFITGYLPFFVILIMAVINYSIMTYYARDLFSAGVKSDILIRHINVHVQAMMKIYQRKFTSEAVDALTANISEKTIKEVFALEKIVRWLNSRANPIYGILNAFLLIDLFSFQRLAEWVKRNYNKLGNWFDTVYEMEMYCSLAAWKFHNPDYIIPEFSDSPCQFDAKDLGHPLIDKKEVVKNDFSFDQAAIYLVTGSNMSGKSTFLRTVGLNVLMAWTGLPVYAVYFKTSRFILFTSMRTQDNLAENTSSFYAELKRIKRLFALIDESKYPVLFFLDEILKGTNSDDRHTGSRGIVEKLLKKNCIGFISTHDLQLADEYQDHPMIENISFNSHLEDGRLIFDYKLTEGKCHSTNATLLMRSMDILD